LRNSHHNGVKDAFSRLKMALATTFALGALILALYIAEPKALAVLELALPPELAGAVYFAAFSVAALAFSYALARLVYKVGALTSAAITAASPRLKPLGPPLRVFFALAALLAFTVALLNLLSLKVSAVAGFVEWLTSALGGFFSMLIALILALQVKEIVGNYLAWLIIKFGGLVEEGDFVSFGGEFLKVVRVGSSHTLLVNTFEEEVYVPNLKFLLEAYRKPFSRRGRRYLEVCFTLPYSYPYREVAARVHKALMELDCPEASIASYRLLVRELQPYAVVYELRVKPSKPVFPNAFNSAVMAALLEEFGEALSTPALVSLTDRRGPEARGREPSSPPSSEG